MKKLIILLLVGIGVVCSMCCLTYLFCCLVNCPNDVMLTYVVCVGAVGCVMSLFLGITEIFYR